MNASATSVAALQAAHGTEIDGHLVRVSIAKPPKSRFGGSLAEWTREAAERSSARPTGTESEHSTL